MSVENVGSRTGRPRIKRIFLYAGLVILVAFGATLLYGLAVFLSW
ncbi:hypothetical protein FHU41_002159 [Psychromicrobium silvestre]|uniref:Uncharacterized protein n=1 Tax=Psychromicrobium silvestre TaxID=1645614 RepID=A0A7Y9LUQ2_9MICC|nr:hypothetical protein [Psychromicrobium silvestre]NYE95909.1 hypothetical protein [Psychromicrobium silvestre]